MKVNKTIASLIVLLALLVGFLIGRSADEDVSQPGATSLGEASPASAWTCSMHPQVRLAEPGPCPICFMDLIPVIASDTGLGPRGLVISEMAMALAEIETAPVERRAVEHEVRMVGKVAFDETRMSYLTARVGGRLDRLFVDYTGVKVREGDHMVEIYSPELYVAQQELLQAIETDRRMGENSLPLLRESSAKTIESARERLRLFGMTQEQVDAIVERGSADEHVTLYATSSGVVVHKNAFKGTYVDEGSLIYTIANLSKLWVLLDAYESDLAWIGYGHEVEFEVRAYPGEPFHGRIAFIDPVLDDETRTVKVRLNVDNPDGRLKPDMFVSAISRAVLTPHGRVVDKHLAGRWMCPMHPEVLADAPDSCRECGMDLVPTSELGFVALDAEPELPLVIPSSAPLITGKRAVVYVRIPDTESPTFLGREVRLGPRAGNWYVVHEGLELGEQVVVKGNFKLDSELQIRAAPSMMNPTGGAAPGGHNHGGAPPTPRPAPEALESSPAFRAGLGALVSSYSELQRGLAADDDATARAAAEGLLHAFEALDTSGLQGHAAHRWEELGASLHEGLTATLAAEEIEARRLTLPDLTAALMLALEHFGYEHELGPIEVFHCPMAMDGEGGDWLQFSGETANPYYGSSMLRCGSSQRPLKMEH